MTEAPAYATATFVSDPETGERLIVECDQEYLDLIGAFLESHCKHVERTVYRYRVANGAVQIRKCCSGCGQGFGPAMSQKDRAWVATLPWLPSELAEGYESRRLVEKQRMLLTLARKQHAERGAFTKSYTEYLASAEWQAKRQLVFKRCGGTCEGCGVRSATEVHHWTYEHLFDELLFELYGLCHDCHERITSEKRNREAVAREAKATQSE